LRSTPVLEQSRVVLQRRAEERFPGRNSTTKSADSGTWSQYPLPASLVTCARTWAACSLRRASRASGSAASTASRYARRGAFASTTTLRPPRKRHNQVRAQVRRLGRHGLLDLEVAVLLHAGQLDDAPQLDLAPAAPHLGRTQGLHQFPGFSVSSPFWPSARLDSRVVSWPRSSCRFDSTAARVCSTLSRAVRIGSSTAWMLCWRSARSCCAAPFSDSNWAVARSRKRRAFRVEAGGRQCLERAFEALFGVLVDRQALRLPFPLLGELGGKLALASAQGQQVGGRSLDLGVAREQAFLELRESARRSRAPPRRPPAAPPGGWRRGASAPRRRPPGPAAPWRRRRPPPTRRRAGCAPAHEPAGEDAQDEAAEGEQEEIGRNRHGSKMMAALRPRSRPPPPAAHPRGRRCRRAGNGLTGRLAYLTRFVSRPIFRPSPRS